MIPSQTLEIYNIRLMNPLPHIFKIWELLEQDRVFYLKKKPRIFTNIILNWQYRSFYKTPYIAFLFGAIIWYNTMHTLHQKEREFDFVWNWNRIIILKKWWVKYTLSYMAHFIVAFIKGKKHFQKPPYMNLMFSRRCCCLVYDAVTSK